MDLRRHYLGTAPLGIFTPLVVALALACSASTVALPAQNPVSLEPIRRMEHRYRAAKTLQATFLERYTENGRTVRVESGMAYFRRPGKMRWEYAAPENNLFLIDGKLAWFYVPADHTVTRVPAKQSTDWRTPLALLAGETKVSRVCARVELSPDEPPEKAGDAVFTCTVRGAAKADSTEQRERGGPRSASTSTSLEPQQSEQEDTVLLEIAPESGELVRIVVRNKGGVGIEFHFAQWLDDPPIAEALFHFQPPPGVAIVNAELPSQAANPN
jgi:outer membrane lipoprotein carrier protein